MKPVEFVGQTRVLNPPQGYDNGVAATKVGGLPIAIETDAHNIPFLVSCWKPSPEDIEALRAGAVVKLSVMGVQMPPVNVFVDRVEILP